MRRATLACSRAIDLALATLLLLLTLPIVLLCALAIRLESPGPAFFTQSRFGRGGLPFAMHKLRTLRVDLDAPGPITPEGDQHITRCGRWLRRYHVDELPQLYDVLRGRMALVGPRPEVPDNLSAIGTCERRRLFAVRPGITGPTQLAFVSEDEVLAGLSDPVAAYRTVLLPAKVHHDLEWLERRSLAGDLLILLRTPFVVMSRRARLVSRDRVSGILAAAREQSEISLPSNTAP